MLLLNLHWYVKCKMLFAYSSAGDIRCFFCTMPTQYLFLTFALHLSFFKDVDLNSKTNSAEHHTSVITTDQLIVRRGQPFTVTLQLTQPFNPNLYPLTVVSVTGQSLV